MSSVQILRFEEVSQESARRTVDRDRFTRRFLVEISGYGGHIDAMQNHRPDLLPARLLPPGKAEPHPENDQLYVVEWWPEQRPNIEFFDLTVEYGNVIPNITNNPLELPADITVETARIQEVITHVAYGNPLVNTAGTPIPDVVEDDPLWILDVSKNVPRFPPWLWEYNNVVNSDTVRIEGHNFPPRTLHLQRARIESKLRGEEGTEYRPMQLQLVYRKKTWDQFLLNRGYEEIVIRRRTEVHREWKIKGRPVTKGKAQTIASVAGNILAGPIGGLAGKLAGKALDELDLEHTEYVERFVRERVRCKTPEGEDLSEPAFLDAYGRRPRVDRVGKDVTDPLIEGTVKQPLDRDDIIVLRFSTKKPVPFRVLPLR